MSRLVRYHISHSIWYLSPTIVFLPRIEYNFTYYHNRMFLSELSICMCKLHNWTLMIIDISQESHMAEYNRVGRGVRRAMGREIFNQ